MAKIRKWTKERIIEYVESQGYKFIEFIEYKGINSMIKIWCKNPEHEPYEVGFNNFYRDRRCKKCRLNESSNRQRKTHKQFVKEMAIKNPNIEILSEYNGAFERVDCRCKIDGYEWSPIANNILNQNSNCPKCLNSLKRTHEDFIKEMNIINSNIEILTEYIDIYTKVKCRCRIDDNIWWASPNNLLRDRGCPECAKRIKRNKLIKSHEKFVEEMLIINPNIEIISKYNGSHEYVSCRCKIDNNVWLARPCNLLSGYGCPKCNQSKGEKEIEKILLQYNINFIPQKEYEGLLGIGNGNLSYDFYLPDYNLLIEYQGEFHDGTAYQQTEDEFKVQQEHDRRKKQYAVDNNIKFIEIWYWDFKNIEEILKRELNL